MMDALVSGGYLTLEGIAAILGWFSLLRLVNIAHIALAESGHGRGPRHIMAPMFRRSDSMFAVVAFMAACASGLAFATPASLAARHPIGDLPLFLQLVRIALALVILLFFLTRVAEHPRYKLVWAACWGAFSLAVVTLA